MDPVETGKLLRELRGEKSQAEVADAVGISQQALSNYEKGLRVPKDQVKIALACYYEQPVSIFYADKAYSE